jgi:hypothetical protein
MQFRGIPTDPKELEALGQELVRAWLAREGESPGSRRRLITADDVRSVLGHG